MTDEREQSRFASWIIRLLWPMIGWEISRRKDEAYGYGRADENREWSKRTAGLIADIETLRYAASENQRAMADLRFAFEHGEITSTLQQAIEQRMGEMAQCHRDLQREVLQLRNRMDAHYRGTTS